MRAGSKADLAWVKRLPRDPLRPLLGSRVAAIELLTRRDLLGEVVDITSLWELREPARLLRRQRSDGAWTYPAGKNGPQNYDLLETFRSLGILVAEYGFDRRHPGIERAARYVLECQSPEGDLRGIYGTQPAHTYTGGLLELLIQAGYGDHPAIARAFRWLVGTRQEDGGWAIPARTRDRRLVRDWRTVMAGPPIEADRSKPSSHLVTGMVLRAFAAHPRQRRSAAASRAGRLLEARILKPDPYPDRRAAAYWTRCSYPFWFTDVISALDTLGRIGLSPELPGISRAMAWLGSRQRRDGTFDLTVLRGKDPNLPLWLGLAISRAVARFG